MKIGVFGGTFNPPHLGHLILAAEARYRLGLELVLFLLTPDPPHKQDHVIIPSHHRLKMLQTAIAGDETFRLSRVDVDRPPPHYAVDTMHLLRERHPRDELIYLMGGDSLRDLALWHKPLEFIGACHALGVMRRPGDRLDLPSLEAGLPGVSSKVLLVDAPLLEISATDIRRRIAGGRPYRYFLPPAVYAIIRDNEIYRGRVIE